MLIKIHNNLICKLLYNYFSFLFQVQVIEYDDESGLVSKRSYDHPAGEIWRLSSAPQTADLIASVYNTSH